MNNLRSLNFTLKAKASEKFNRYNVMPGGFSKYSARSNSEKGLEKSNMN